MIMITKKQFAALILFSSMSGSAFSENLIQVYQQALKNDPQLKASEAGYLAALEQKPQALSALHPQVSVSGSGTYTMQHTGRSYTYDNQSAYANINYSLNLTKPLYRKSIIAQLDLADASILKAQASLEADRQSLILRVAEAYLAFLKAKDNAKFSKLETSAIGRQLNQVKVYFEAGRSAITDVKEAQARYDLARSSEIAAAQQIDLARESLKAISGLYYKDLWGAANSIPLLTPKPDNIEAWSRASINNSKAVTIAEYSVQVAQSNVDLTRSGKSPTVDLFAKQGSSATQSFESTFNQDKFDASIGVQVNIPLYTGGNTASRIRQARHQLQQSRHALEAQKRSVIEQTRAAYLSTVSGLAQVRALKKALESNQTAANATQTGFEVGTRTAVDVVLALRETFSAQRNFTNARYDFLLNTLKLKQAAGTLNLADLNALSKLLTSPSSSRTTVTKYKQ